jgi:hypothetical protein
MSQYQYRVVPFIGRISSGQTADLVAQQLEAVIQQQASEGWEFHSVTDVTIEVKPGCLAGLLGGEVSYQTYNQVIFRR